MDQGWAAVMAGVAGLLGAGVGGYFAMRGAQAGARTTAEAIAEQVERQAANEHAHWIRQERRQAFREIVAAYSEVAERLVQVRKAISREAPTEALVASAEEACNQLATACGSIAMIATDQVWRAAARLHRAVDESVRAHRELALRSTPTGSPSRARLAAQVATANRSMGDRYKDFSRACYEALFRNEPRRRRGS